MPDNTTALDETRNENKMTTSKSGQPIPTPEADLVSSAIAEFLC